MRVACRIALLSVVSLYTPESDERMLLSPQIPGVPHVVTA